MYVLGSSLGKYLTFEHKKGKTKLFGRYFPNQTNNEKCSYRQCVRHSHYVVPLGFQTH